MNVFYVEVWDGERWQRLSQEFSSRIEADRWCRGQPMCRPYRVVED